MSNKNNGGPAFPAGGLMNREYEMAFDGMTLRDWFAGQALSGVLACSRDYRGYSDGLDDRVRMAYDYADAMLKEREK